MKLPASGTLKANEVAHVPAKCPSCGSREILTTSKVIDASAYWRCETCGEVWNIGRQRGASRYPSYPPYGR